MPKFSKRSLDNLATADSRLQKLFNEVIKEYDCTVICGHRGKEEQTKAFNEKKSKLKFPQSKHNSLPSKAVDVVPYPINWTDIERFKDFGKFVLKKAAELGINIRWGADWDMDGDSSDERFLDFPHFEIKE